MKQLYFICLVLLSIVSCKQSNSQEGDENTKGEGVQEVGGRCEGCEVIYKSPVPFSKLNWIDTLPDFQEEGPRLQVSGTVYQNDGITPAKDVVLYVYHTDQTGKYTNRYGEKGEAGNHGYIKGWMKTNEKGHYRFYTLKPAPYPTRDVPAHIHLIIKEEGKSEYWADDFLFADDPLLTAAERKKLQERGGNGILKLQNNGLLTANRNIILGKNIPNYPHKKD